MISNQLIIQLDQIPFILNCSPRLTFKQQNFVYQKNAAELR